MPKLPERQIFSIEEIIKTKDRQLASQVSDVPQLPTISIRKLTREWGISPPRILYACSTLSIPVYRPSFGGNPWKDPFFKFFLTPEQLLQSLNSKPIKPLGYEEAIYVSDNFRIPLKDINNLRAELTSNRAGLTSSSGGKPKKPVGSSDSVRKVLQAFNDEIRSCTSPAKRKPWIVANRWNISTISKYLANCKEADLQLDKTTIRHILSDNKVALGTPPSS